jgi:hypothetical protein
MAGAIGHEPRRLDQPAPRGRQTLRLIAFEERADRLDRRDERGFRGIDVR